MAQKLGSGVTTDNTSTSNEIHFAGEVVSYAYEIKDGDKASSLAADLTGYTAKVYVQAMELGTAGDLSTATKKSGATVHEFDATIDTPADGIIRANIPSNILKTAGFTLAPAIGLPLYIAYEVKYFKGTEFVDIIESDIIEFIFSLSFDITA